MNDFKGLREKIDSLIGEAKSWIERKSIHQSMERLEKANEQLVRLKQLADGEIQNRVVSNRTFELESLARKVDEVLSKREAGKKEAI